MRGTWIKRMVGDGGEALSLNDVCARAVVSVCFAWGIEDVVISPGSRSTPLVLAVQEKSWRGYRVLDERDAGFFALGIARVRRRAVLLICTSGSALGHYLPAVMEAYHAGEPLLICSADRPLAWHGCGGLQTARQQQLFGGFVRYFAQAPGPEESGAALAWSHMTSTALRYAHGVPMGPVHMNLPFCEPVYGGTAGGYGDVREDGEAPCGVVDMRSCGRERVGGGADDWRRLGWPPVPGSLGAFLVGPLPYEREGVLAAALGRLAGVLGWPIIAEFTSHVRFHGACRDYVLAGGMRSIREGSCPALSWVICLGGALLSKSALHWLEGCARVLHILEGYAEVPRWPHALAVWGDMAQILHRLADGVAPAGAGPVALPAVWQRAEAEHCDWSAREAGRGFFGGSIIRTLCSTLPDGSAVLVGNSLLSRQLEDYGVAASRDVHIFGQRGLNGIDGNIAGFLGLSAAWPAERVVVGLIGDLAFLHNCSALMLSAMLEPICGRILIVVDNGGGGIFDTLPIARAQPGIFGEYFRFNHGWDVSAWADAAEIPCVRVSSVGEFGQALAESYKKPLLQMIWCRVDADLR